MILMKSLYPETKCTPARAIDMLDTNGYERLWLNSACDWGVSDPWAGPKTALEMKKRSHLAPAIHNVVSENLKKFPSQSPNFKAQPKIQ
jgi:predicted metal-dependent TIM-barrel fold hydrolase